MFPSIWSNLKEHCIRLNHCEDSKYYVFENYFTFLIEPRLEVIHYQNSIIEQGDGYRVAHKEILMGYGLFEISICGPLCDELIR